MHKIFKAIFLLQAPQTLQDVLHIGYNGLVTTMHVMRSFFPQYSIQAYASLDILLNKTIFAPIENCW